jgi:hypothetical protein
MKVRLDVGDNYPTFYLTTDKDSSYSWEVEVTEEFYEEYKRTTEEWNNMQVKLDKLHNVVVRQ